MQNLWQVRKLKILPSDIYLSSLVKKEKLKKVMLRFYVPKFVRQKRFKALIDNCIIWHALNVQDLSFLPNNFFRSDKFCTLLDEDEEIHDVTRRVRLAITRSIENSAKHKNRPAVVNRIQRLINMAHTHILKRICVAKEKANL